MSQVDTRPVERWLGLPENLFLVLAAVFGAAMALVTPPFDAPDEWRHLSRAYLISEGRLKPIGTAAGYDATIPYDLVMIHEFHGPLRRDHHAADVFDQLQAPFDPARRIPLGSGKFVLYSAGISSPLSHAPQAAALLVGRGLGLSGMALLYVARFSTLVTWISLCWLAIRLSPLCSWSFAVLCLMPMSLFLAGSVSADPLVSATSLLLLSLVLRAAFGQTGAVDRGTVTAILLLSASLGLLKPGYSVLVALVLLVPLSRFSASRVRWGLIGGVALAATIPPALWAHWVMVADPAPMLPGTDPRAQLRQILAAPFGYVLILARAVGTQAPSWVIGWIGKLGYLDVKLPLLVYVAQPAALIAVTLMGDAGRATPRLRERLILICIAVASVATIVTLNYLAWDPVGAHRLTGIQGRYFIPLVPLLVAAVPGLGIRSRATTPYWIGGLCSGVLGVTVFALLRHYYWDL